MKKLIAAGAAAAIAAGVMAVPSLGAKTRTKTVAVRDNKFGPTSITVRRGTKVRWVWHGKAPHNVTVTKGPQRFRSSTQVRGRFTKRLTKKGTYTILCTVHPATMRMTIRVK